DVTPTPLPVGQIVSHTYPTSYTDGIRVPVEFHYTSGGGNDSMSYHFSGAYDFTTLLATASPFPPNVNLRHTHPTTFRANDGLRVQGFFWTGDYNDVDLNISNIAVVISGNAIPCGNGIVEGGEQCDEGADNGTEGSCCLQDCTLRPQGSVCRPLQDSQCDLEE